MSLIKIVKFEILGDHRGSLVSVESNKNIPFKIKRAYYIFGTKSGISRGYHAHKKLSQVIVCLAGSCRIVLDDGYTREETVISSPSKGLLINGLIWREMHDFSPDCLLLVFASDYYFEPDYIRDYSEFLKTVKGKR